MPTVNLTTYDPKPLTMQFGATRVVSRVPNGQELKLMKALMEYSSKAAVVSQMTATMGDNVQEAVNEIPVPEALQREEEVDIAELALGAEELERLRAAGVYEPLIEKAAMYAVMYWATGESTLAGNAWLEQLEADRNPKAPRSPRPQRRRDQKGKKRRNH